MTNLKTKKSVVSLGDRFLCNQCGTNILSISDKVNINLPVCCGKIMEKTKHIP